MKPRRFVNALPFAQLVNNVLDLLDFVRRTFAGVDIGNMDYRFFLGVQHLHDVVGVSTAVKIIADVQRLEVLVAAQLLVIRVGDRVEFLFVFGQQHRYGITAKVGTRHRHDVRFIALDDLA